MKKKKVAKTVQSKSKPSKKAQKTTSKVAKKATKKAAKKTVAAKKTTAKKAPAKKQAKAPATKKATASKKTVKKAAKKAAPAKKVASKSSAKQSDKEAEIKEIITAKRKKNEAAKASNTFTMDDVMSFLKENKKEKKEESVPVKKAAAVKKVAKKAAPKKNQVLGAASIADILGFNPATKEESVQQREESQVPKKWIKYYRSLMELRDHLAEGLSQHANETLKRGSSSVEQPDRYGQDAADIGAESFDRDLALSMANNEQDVLNEVDAAIDRIFDGSYGICEITSKPINKERLSVVPFTRYSLEGQQQAERSKQKVQRFQGNVFEEAGEELSSFSNSSDD